MGVCIVVTGMHRSGTSLLASYLQRCGLNIGHRLIGPNFDNPKGYFEDEEFVEFHKEVLDRNGMDMLNPRREPLFSARDVKKAANLVRKRSELELWGWKDPRTVLFLDFWDALVDARYIFIYRRPAQVVDSLIRRGTDPIIRLNPIYGAVAWVQYNRRILEFVFRHPKRCVLISLEELISNSSSFVRFVNAKFGVFLEPKDIKEVFDDTIIKLGGDLTEDAKRVLEECGEAMDELYKRLEEARNIPDIGFSSRSLREVAGVF